MPSRAAHLSAPGKSFTSMQLDAGTFPSGQKSCTRDQNFFSPSAAILHAAPYLLATAAAAFAPYNILAMPRCFFLFPRSTLLSLALFLAGSAQAQIACPTPSLGSPACTSTGMSLADPTITPDTQLLFDLEARFAQDVAKGGGPAFASWFADNAVVLSNKQAPVFGKAAIAAQTTWTPDQYQLTWKPDGARMDPSHTSGFTWGSYQGHSKDNQGNPLVVTGRYVTVWGRDANGQWKVLLDTSNEAPPDAGACCSIH
jgi:ketosteroid isomerase-like protein